MEIYEQASYIQTKISELMLILAVSEGTNYLRFYREMNAYLSTLDLTKSSVCENVAKGMAKFYKSGDALALRSAKNLDRALEWTYNGLLKDLPRNAMRDFTQLNRILLNMTLDGSMTLDDAAALAVKNNSFKGLTVQLKTSTGKVQNYQFDKLVKRTIRDQMKESLLQTSDEIAAEFNTEVYQVSSHKGARPLCSLYQGKLITDNPSITEFTDYKGDTHEVIYTGDIESYHYGGGLFGNNCRHMRWPLVDGFDTPAFDPILHEDTKINKFIK